ncbi:MAG: glycosyl transferase [Oscillospiraceae bacterium]|nr:glycosyl transferase [Oscillospiraceae bacterium]
MSLAGLKYFLNKPGGWFFFLQSRGLLNWMDDEAYIKRLFCYSRGYALDLEHPKTFNEKLQWLKLHDRRPLYTKLVDKYEVKDYVAEKVGSEYVIPVIAGPWDSADEIDFDALPEQFVLKCTHDSGGVVICRGKAALDRRAAEAKLRKAMKRNFFWPGREWPYKNVKPRIFVERYVEDESGELRDYKIFVFHGQPFCIQVDYARFTDHHRNFYDLDWNYLPFTTEYPTDPSHVIARPACLDGMLELARRLSDESIPFLRVDLYVVGDRPLFGEFTFFHGSGLEPFMPEEWDRILGAQLRLPTDEEPA